MLRAFWSAPSGRAGLFVVVVVLIAAAVAPAWLGQHASDMFVLSANSAPSSEHWLGTDQLGRDIFARLLVASRLSLFLALLTTAAGAVLGMGLGAATALLSGVIRVAVLRAIDMMLAFPTIIVAIFVSAIVGSGSVGATLGVAAALSFQFARIASNLALSIGGRDYVAAAKVTGVRRWRLLTGYIFPNIAEPLIITTAVAVGTSIVSVSSLSFLGLGVQPPAFDWGRMLTEGVQAIYVNPGGALGPAAAIAITALAFGLLGEAAARATNPLLWGHSPARPLAGIRNPFPSSSRYERPRLKAEAVLLVSGLTVSVPNGRAHVPVVLDLSFDLRRGERLGIVGESGSGKTMTALALTHLLPSSAVAEGQIYVEGQELQKMSKRAETLLGTATAVVFQDPMTSLNPALKIGTQLIEGAVHNRHQRASHARRIAIDRLNEVRIPSAAMQMQRHPHELSGGMRQRAMIAMGLMNEPSILIADEPTTALDVTIQAQIIRLLHEVSEAHGMAVVLISHNLAVVGQFCDRVIVMYAGSMVEELSRQQLKDDPWHPYTRALMAAISDMGHPRDQPLASIPGQAPDPARRPTGCPFHDRCPDVLTRCRSEMPPLVRSRSGRRIACWAVNNRAEHE